MLKDKFLVACSCAKAVNWLSSQFSSSSDSKLSLGRWYLPRRENDRAWGTSDCLSESGIFPALVRNELSIVHEVTTYTGGAQTTFKAFHKLGPPVSLLYILVSRTGLFQDHSFLLIFVQSWTIENLRCSDLYKKVFLARSVHNKGFSTWLLLLKNKNCVSVLCMVA